MSARVQGTTTGHLAAGEVEPDQLCWIADSGHLRCGRLGEEGRTSLGTEWPRLVTWAVQRGTAARVDPDCGNEPG